MKVSQINQRILVLITTLGVVRLAHGGSIKLFGPKCGEGFDDEKGNLKCGASVEPSKDVALGALCSENQTLQVRVVRQDVDVEGKLRLVRRLYIYIYIYIYILFEILQKVCLISFQCQA